MKAVTFERRKRDDSFNFCQKKKFIHTVALVWSKLMKEVSITFSTHLPMWHRHQHEPSSLTSPRICVPYLSSSFYERSRLSKSGSNTIIQRPYTEMYIVFYIGVARDLIIADLPRREPSPNNIWWTILTVFKNITLKNLPFRNFCMLDYIKLFFQINESPLSEHEFEEGDFILV